MKTRPGVLGDAHLDRAEANKTWMDTNFQNYITESAREDVWSSNVIDRRTRSLITVFLLAGLGHYEDLAMHIRACQNTGASVDV